MQIIIVLLFIIVIPIFSDLYIKNWYHYNKPTFKPTFKPITVFPIEPSYTPTQKPTKPTFTPTYIPTTPTVEPTTHLPTVYDIKTMNNSGYIAICVLVPYIFIVCMCTIIGFIVKFICCSDYYFIETDIKTHEKTCEKTNKV